MTAVHHHNLNTHQRVLCSFMFFLSSPPSPHNQNPPWGKNRHQRLRDVRDVQPARCSKFDTTIWATLILIFLGVLACHRSSRKQVGACQNVTQRNNLKLGCHRQQASGWTRNNRCILIYIYMYIYTWRKINIYVYICIYITLSISNSVYICIHLSLSIYLSNIYTSIHVYL